MNGSDTRVTTYLDDLARMLSDLDPGTRDDVLAGVREHLDAVATEHPDDPGALEAALVRLGPPERIAAEARADQPATPPPSWTVAPPRPLHPLRVRIAVVASLATVALPAALVFVGRIGEVLSQGQWGLVFPHPLEIAMLTQPLLLPIWLVATTVAVVGAQPATRTKVELALLGPAMTVAVVAGALFLDPMVISTPLVLVLTGAVLVGAVVTARRTWREAPLV
ncbi:hypothetical protein [Arthrobacter sp. NEB 688]|uniref:HAAS signaling domain-containing protein n=1 Tax=Arthrobacter sp. NEB 688 TaxID=904039 RepID=UPI001564804C|nr:hypothetical protein [Arthrobacter sp. NEB 688]QKE82828.1 hypothetical protein HL663_01925 [Arthrobacter sp. NEB 688]